LCLEPGDRIGMVETIEAVPKLTCDQIGPGLLISVTLLPLPFDANSRSIRDNRDVVSSLYVGVTGFDDSSDIAGGSADNS